MRMAARSEIPAGDKVPVEGMVVKITLKSKSNLVGRPIRRFAIIQRHPNAAHRGGFFGVSGQGFWPNASNICY